MWDLIRFPIVSQNMNQWEETWSIWCTFPLSLYLNQVQMPWIDWGTTNKEICNPNLPLFRDVQPTIKDHLSDPPRKTVELTQGSTDLKVVKTPWMWVSIPWRWPVSACKVCNVDPRPQNLKSEFLIPFQSEQTFSILCIILSNLVAELH